VPRFVDENAGAKGGLRERKRRETFQRVTETGLSLFIANGYEATTLEAIASAAGISRRTFFYYFKSKDDILLSLQSGLVNALHAALKDEPLDESPLDAVRNALLKIFARYRSDEMIVIDRLMRSSETLRVRKQASYVQQEQELFAALCERWPDPGRKSALRLVAMVSIGAMRLSIDAWSQEGGKRPVAKFLREAFSNLKAEI
jgi:AcrR family transcriptional regulator